MKKGLTRAGAVAMLAATQATLKGRNTEELKDPLTLKAIKGDLAKAAGMDVESISLEIGTVKDIESNIPDKFKVMGNVDSNVKYDPKGRDIESFDAVNTTDNDEIKLAAINVVSANYTSKEDGFLDLFTRETIDGKSVGKEIRALAPNITVGATLVNGQSVGGEKVNLISNLDNTAIFGAARIPYMPVLRSTGDYKTVDFLADELAANVTYNGEEVETAPLLVGKTISLRRVCSTTQYLTQYKDQFNPSITLAADGGVKEVVVKLVGDANLVNEIVFPVAGEKSSKYAPLKNAKEKDMNLSFTTTQRISLATFASLVKYTSTNNSFVLANGAGEAIEVDVRFTVNAKVNTDSMVFTSSATQLEVVGMYNNTVAMDSSAARYIEIAGILTAGTVHAINMAHFLSNTNNLENGMVIDVEGENFIIPAVYRTPATINKSILGDTPNEDIPGYISAAKIALNSQKVVEAIELVDSFIESVEGKTDSDTGVVLNYISTGVGSNFIKPLVKKFDINATNKSTRRSAEKKDDISFHIYDAIINRAIKAYSDSNIDKAVDAILPNEEVTLQIVAGGNIATYIKSALADDDGRNEYPFKIEVSTSIKTGNKVYTTFKIGDKVNELSPMILVESPDHVYKAVQTTGNGSSDVTKMIPRRGMELNAPVLLVATVTGIIDAFNN